MHLKLITQHNSVPLWPLTAWQTIVEKRLARGIDDDVSSWCIAMNNQALIALHRGQSDQAVILCEKQLSDLSKFHASQGAESCANLIWQPLINLTKLQAKGENLCVRLNALYRLAGGGVTKRSLGSALSSELQRHLVNDPKRNLARNAIAFHLAVALTRQGHINNCKKSTRKAIHLATGSLKQELQVLRELCSFASSTKPKHDVEIVANIALAFHLVNLDIVTSGEAEALARSIFLTTASQARQSNNLLVMRIAVEFLKLLPAGRIERDPVIVEALQQLLKLANFCGDQKCIFDILSALKTQTEYRKKYDEFVAICEYSFIKAVA